MQQPGVQPTMEGQRLETLDVLRGFALLGILLMNIVGFGMLASTYSNPGLALASLSDIVVWSALELTAEGAMRCLFSILFGAGVVMFTVGSAGKSASTFYKRNFWLLLFGLFDAYVLLWTGDILVNYALAGALLYWVRNVRAKRLLITAGVLILLMSVQNFFAGWGLGQARQAAIAIESQAVPSGVSSDEYAARALLWNDFARDFQPTEAEANDELKARAGSYASAFAWNIDEATGMLLFVLPLFLFWDALAMMLVGMALYKFGILQGERSPAFYLRLALTGFAIGLGINAVEVMRAINSQFDLLAIFAQAQATYHVGRLGVTIGYLGLIIWLIQGGYVTKLRQWLANVGRLALTNYLAQSLICLFVFTGAGFSLVGELSRSQLYLVVVAIWLFQLWFSTAWLQRHRFGPVEWLWRGLTYGAFPAMRR